MEQSRSWRRVGLRGGLAALTGLSIVGGVSSLSAHNMSAIPAPRVAAPAITINGAPTEAVWGSGVATTPSPNTCVEFGNGTGTPIRVYATKDRAAPPNLFLGLDIPDDSPDAADRLFLFFDSNHAAGAALQADDVALDLPFGAAVAANVAFAGAHKFTGSAANWSAPAALPAGILAKYSREAARVRVELKIPSSEVAIPAVDAMGFAFIYLNQTALDCGSGVVITFKPAWPAALAASATTLPTDANHPNQWGDVGLDLPTVGFTSPLCCHSPDITFVPSGQPFTPGVPVDIKAEVHSLNTAASGRAASKVNVEVRVHDFGTGGGTVVFTSPNTVIPGIAAGGSSKTGPVTWPSPPPGLHGCIRAEIKEPTPGSEYAIGSGAEIAQYNTDTLCLGQGAKKTLQFITFNPDKTKTQAIKLIAQQRGPKLAGFAFELTQPREALGPLKEARVAMTVSAGANVPPTNLPRQTRHVPPTAGYKNPVALKVRPGEELHLSAVGDVDIDGRGPVAATGPDGADVSRVLRGKFLLPGEAAPRVGGALIGSFDAFKTSFLIGSEVTLTVPEKRDTLSLAINDVVDQNADNTGKGFDVDAVTLPVLPRQTPARGAATTAPREPPFPELRIVATTTRQLRVIGGERAYNVFSNVGSVVYQVLITGRKAGMVEAAPKYYPWALPLIPLGIVAFVVRKKGKSA